LFCNSVAFALRAHRGNHQLLGGLGAVPRMADSVPRRRLLWGVAPNSFRRVMPCDQLFDGAGEF
jgi:hypothetical protein